MRICTGSLDIEPVFQGLLNAGIKTTSSLTGQRHISRLILSITKVVELIFPVYGPLLAPLNAALSTHKNVCDGLKVISAVDKFNQAKKVSVHSVLLLLQGCLISFIGWQNLGVIPSFSSMANLSKQTGSVSVYQSSSMSSAIKGFVLTNIKHLLLGVSSGIGIVVIIIKMAAAKTDEQKQKAFASEKFLLLVMMTGQIAISVLSIFQFRLLPACLQIGVNVIGYSRFLISPSY